MRKHLVWIVFAGLASMTCLAYARQASDGGSAECIANQKQLALGVIMYIEDYDERYPIMTTTAQLQHRVRPYVKSTSTFKCPSSGEDYLGNPALNYQKMGEIKDIASTILLRDAKPHKTETGAPAWVVAYTNGRQKLVSTEPLLGKPALAPTRQSRIRELQQELASMRKHRIDVDKSIRDMEAELKRLTRKK